MFPGKTTHILLLTLVNFTGAFCDSDLLVKETQSLSLSGIIWKRISVIFSVSDSSQAAGVLLRLKHINTTYMYIYVIYNYIYIYVCIYN